MKRTKIRLTDIAPDNVRIVIDWDKFVTGASVFIPCINTVKAIREVKEVTGLSNEEITHRVRIEDSKYGVRIWRLI